MQNRRQFIRAAAMLSGASGMLDRLIGAIQRAQAIEPEQGSSVLDAEHVVILMQENRSFDHVFGSLRGVRGFNDPRAIRLPDGNPVWVQANAAGERYAPFRLDIKETKSTWMGSLPHGWPDQVDAANGGKHDRWLDAKKSGHPVYAKMPLTLGYHTRGDIPFYYALADAFTICDQYFCSSLTATTPNRLHLWTGTVRAKPTADSPALIRNEDCDYGHWVDFTTFPERLEDHGISWKIYQNELTVPNGLTSEADAWLANFGDSPIEWFSQFHVRFAENHHRFLAARIQPMTREIEALRKRLSTESGDAAEAIKKRINDLSANRDRFQKDHDAFSAENFAKLSPREKSLHARAFATNSGDPFYRELAEFVYKDGDTKRKLKVPKGDLFHQFRKDVETGDLPTVSWLVAPENLSDHPAAAWYGSWYVSEVLDILTKNPNVWKKTVFLLTYDENDGYFDHVPPFQAPHPKRSETGLVSKGIDAAIEYVELEQDRKQKPSGATRGNSIGLGFRVPMIIASPWSRGGCVCSQVLDHTSVLQFLETLLTHKTGKKIEESNISAWRRTICGDLTSAFQSTHDSKPGLEQFLNRDAVVEQIHRARFKKLPAGFRPLTQGEIERIRLNPRDSLLPRQETGVRRSSPLPYQLEVDGSLNADRTQFTIHFEGKKEIFGERSAGAPFIAYAFTAHGPVVRHYTVAAGDRLEDSWPLNAFEKGRYHFRVHGPNGFYREFQGDANDPKVVLNLEYSRGPAAQSGLTGNVTIQCHNREPRDWIITVRDQAHGNAKIRQTLNSGAKASLTVDCLRSFGWYDFIVQIAGVQSFEKRYAGRVETGQWSFSDPAMGK